MRQRMGFGYKLALQALRYKFGKATLSLPFVTSRAKLCGFNKVSPLVQEIEVSKLINLEFKCICCIPIPTMIPNAIQQAATGANHNANIGNANIQGQEVAPWLIFSKILTSTKSKQRLQETPFVKHGLTMSTALQALHGMHHGNLTTTLPLIDSTELDLCILCIFTINPS